MTTDPFTEAASNAAHEYARTPRMNVGTVRDRIAEAHLAGWEAARTHLAAQETDGERAVRELHRPAPIYTLAEDCTDPESHEWSMASHGGDELCISESTGEQFCTECCPENAFDCTDYLYPCATIQALDSARAARRDEEKR